MKKYIRKTLLAVIALTVISCDDSVNKAKAITAEVTELIQAMNRN